MAPPGTLAALEGYKTERSGSVGCKSIDSVIIPIDVPLDFPALTYTFTAAFWRAWGHHEFFFPAWPRTFRLSYTAQPIPFCTCKSIRTRYSWHDALHHLPLTFPIIINNKITT